MNFIRIRASFNVPQKVETIPAPMSLLVREKSSGLDKEDIVTGHEKGREEQKERTGRELIPESQNVAEKDQTLEKNVPKVVREQEERLRNEQKEALTAKEWSQKTKSGTETTHGGPVPDHSRIRETETPNGKEKTMERSGEKEFEYLTRQERERFDRWEVGQKLRFPQENRDLGMNAGEVVRVEEMDRKTGIITLRKENGEEARLIPEHPKRELERQKSMEERSPERKTME